MTPLTARSDRQLYIGGEWIGTGDWIEVRSPYSRDLVGRAAVANATQASAAIDAAERAMETPLPAYERARILERISAGLEERQEEAAQLICAEAGKPFKAARAEARRAASTYAIAAVEARRLAGDVVPMDATEAGVGKLGFSLRMPIGVVAAITPFNFPLNLAAHKLAPALAAGCAVVLKPAEKTPLSAYFLAELATEAGLPAGWLNVVTGEPAVIGEVFVSDERVKAISFTGSAPIGWGLRAQAPKKHVALELGNATPVIVLADADLELAVTKVAENAFSFSGQSCISVQRVFVQRDLVEPFRDRLVHEAEQLIVGDPADEATDVGPVIDDRSRDRILAWIGESGGEILTGGHLSDDGIIRPTVVHEPAPDSHLDCDEVFGPVCALHVFDDFDEALRLANNTRYGLHAAVFTRDLSLALTAARKLEFGGVLINEAPTFRADQMPYGGIKDSGNTREGPRYAVRELTEERLIVLQLPT